MRAHRPARSLQRRAVLRDPGIVAASQRLVEVLLGGAPATERLLGEADLCQRPRRRDQRVGTLELGERPRILASPPQLDPALERGVGIRRARARRRDDARTNA
jgi:hypothetical protein